MCLLLGNTRKSQTVKPHPYVRNLQVCDVRNLPALIKWYTNFDVLFRKDDLILFTHNMLVETVW
jgi:hypothetical protein